MKAYIDGASRGNPGAASIGLVLLDDDGTVLLEKGRCIGRQTNNVAEYSALIALLEEAAIFKPTDLRVHSDSQLLVRQLSGRYKVKQPHLKILLDQAKALIVDFPSVTVVHVPREQNKHADRMANLALDANGTVE